MDAAGLLKGKGRGHQMVGLKGGKAGNLHSLAFTKYELGHIVWYCLLVMFFLIEMTRCVHNKGR
jgi:hypothetical protein